MFGLSTGLAQLSAAFIFLSPLPSDFLPSSVAIPTHEFVLASPAPKPIKTIKPEPKYPVVVPKTVKPAAKVPLLAQASVAPLNNTHELIYKYASEYGANGGIMVQIANCESGMRQEALSSSGTYGGMYQFNTSTWISNRKAMGLDPNPSLRFNGEEAIKTAAFKMGRDGYGAWPACSKKALASK